MYQGFLLHVENRLQALPGTEAQFRMAPALRRERHADLNPDGARASAVLLLLYPEAGRPHTVLMKRAEKIGPHAGQISLPGGRREHSDRNLQHTALRESQEEIGIHPEGIQVLGSLSPLYIPVSHHMVYPFVAQAPHKPQFQEDPKEVAALFSVALADLFHPEARKSTQMPLASGMLLEAPYYDVASQQVWGATAMMLSEFEVLVEGLALE